MQSKIEEKKLSYELFKQFCYVITSARGCIDEPKSYGVSRLLGSVERLVALLDKQGLADNFLKEKGAEIATNKYLARQDKEKFIEFLDKLVIDFTRKLKRARY